MANGDLIEGLNAVGGSVLHASWKMLDGATAVADGVWIDVRGFTRFSVDVSGITTATVQIRGSNDPTKPANATHGRQIGSDITADGITSVDVPVRWLKVRVSAYTSGTINANMIVTTT